MSESEFEARLTAVEEAAGRIQVLLDEVRELASACLAEKKVGER